MRLKKVFKWSFWTIFSIVCLLLLLTLSLQFPYVQNKIKNFAVDYLQNKLKTEVALERFYINFPNELEIDKLFLRDQNQDTLLYAESFRASINLLDLLKNKADITQVTANNLVSYVSRDSLGAFNFDYIVNAFASTDTLHTEKKSSDFTVTLGKINLQNIHFVYNDKVEETYVNLKFKTFDTKFSEFNLKDLIFETPEIKADGWDLQTTFNVKPLVKSTISDTLNASSSSIPQLKINSILFSDFKVSYLDYNSNIDAVLAFETLNSKFKKIDINALDFEVDELDLEKAVVSLKILEDKTIIPKTVKVNSTTAPTPKFKLNNLNINNLVANYSNLNEKPIKHGVDYNYLSFSQIDLNAKDIAYSSDVIQANIQSGYMSEKSGLLIQQLSALFHYKENGIQLSNFKLKTPKSKIVNQTELRYNSITDLSKNLDKVKVESDFINSKLAVSDLLLLVPDLATQDIFQANKNSTLYLDAKVSGTLNNLLVSRFNFSGFGATNIALSGQIKNATQPDKLYLNMQVQELKTTSKDILAFVPKNTIPKSISLPEKLSLKGNIIGNTQDIATQVAIQSSYGAINLDAKINQQIKGNETYSIKANAKNFELGKLIHNDSIGKVSLSIEADGKSFEPKKATATFWGTISDLEYNSYEYHDISLTGNVTDGNYSANLCLIDPNVEIQLFAKGKLTDSYPTVYLEGDVNRLNLQGLNLTQNPIALETKFHADFSDLNPENLNGKLRITNTRYITPNTNIPIDTIKVDIISNPTTNNFYLKSQVLDVTMVGHYKLNVLPQMFMQTLSNYFNITNQDEPYIPTDNTFFTANAQVKNDKILFNLLPNLESFETANLFVWYKADAGAFTMTANFPNLIYGSNNFSNITFKAHTFDEKIAYNFSIKNLQTAAYRIQNISITGDVMNDELSYLFSIKDKKLSNQYKLEGSLSTNANFYKLHLNPSGLILNYEAWDVAQNNAIEWGDTGFLAQNFSLSNYASNLSIQSEKDEFNAPLKINFKNFKIEDITHIIKKDSIAARGTINGFVEFDDLKTDFDFIGNINISDLEYNSIKMGNLSANITQSENKDNYLGTIKLKGEGNDVVLTGRYNSDKNTFAVQSLINALQMQTVQGFSANQISNVAGYISGIMFVKGAPNSLSVLGQTKFNDVGLTINTLNAPLKNINNSIVFNNEGIVFDNFEVTDIDNNKLNLDGKIKTHNYDEFAFDLKLNSKNFTVMNSSEKNNELFYGKMYVDVDMSVKGTSVLPQVNGKININKATDFTVVLPSSDPSIADREGIVEFVDSDSFVFNKQLEIDEQLSQSDIKGINLNAAISISKEATLNVIVDKQHGDKLVLNGSAQLVGGIDPSGGTTLTGTYEIDSGSYDMSFNFIKRKFDIKKGSYIIWTGEPTSAIANITAIYRTNVAPIDLLTTQLDGMSESQQNMYRQRIPFETLLELSGELLKPKLSFNIKLPENNYNVSTEVYNTVEEKLSQMRTDDAEMNKQVIALLIFNRFIGTSAFGSAAGTSVSSIAKKSVSDMVSNELNSIASKLVTGFDLNFGLDSTEDYSTGKKTSRTDLNVEVSKRLFDDRLKITVGSNFGLEGEERANEQATNIAGDISAEYMLTADGRYMIRVYRKNTYQVAFQGQVVETGVTFIITMNYNTYREYVQKNREAREERKKMQQTQKQIKQAEKNNL